MYRHYASVVVLLLLAACGSSPPAPEQAAKADTAASKQEAGDAAAGTTAPVDEPLPPEAVQKFDQAVVHMSGGNAAAAESELRALADAYPTFSGPLLNLGILQTKASRFEDAEKSLRAAVDRNGNNAQAFNQLGIV